MGSFLIAALHLVFFLEEPLAKAQRCAQGQREFGMQQCSTHSANVSSPLRRGDCMVAMHLPLVAVVRPVAHTAKLPLLSYNSYTTHLQALSSFRAPASG